MNDLIPIQNNDLLKSLLYRPYFIDSKKEKELLELIKQNKIDELYITGAKLISSSYEVLHLYVYLFSKLDENTNQEFVEQVCSRLYQISCNNFLEMPDPEIVKFCLKQSKNKVFIKELQKFKEPEYAKDYKSYLLFEEKIKTEYEDLGPVLKKYLDFLKKYGLFNPRIIEKINNATIIMRNGKIIGSLLAEKYQKLLGDTIYPQIEIGKKKGMH